MGTRYKRRWLRKSQTFVSTSGNPDFQQFNNLGDVDLIAGWEDSVGGHLLAESTNMTTVPAADFPDSGDAIDTWNDTKRSNDFRYKFRVDVDQYWQTGRLVGPARGKFNSNSFVEFICNQEASALYYDGMQSPLVRNEGSAGPFTTGSAGSGFSVALIFSMEHFSGSTFSSNEFLFSFEDIGASCHFMTGDVSEPNQFRFLMNNVTASLPSGSIDANLEYLAVMSYDRSANTLDGWIGAAITSSQGTSVPAFELGSVNCTASLGYRAGDLYADEGASAGPQAPSRLHNDNLFVREFAFYNRPMDAGMITRLYEYAALTYGIS